MPAGAKLLVWLMVALWLPATQLCAIECAGLIGNANEAGCCGGPNESGRLSCDTVSRASIGSSEQVKVPSADQLACACARCLRLVEALVAAHNREAIGTLDTARDWLATWAFVRREAPPSRAPTLNV